MNHLSPEAKALVDKARLTDGPSDEDRDRIRQKLVVRLGSSAFVTSAALAAKTGQAATFSSEIPSSTPVNEIPNIFRDTSEGARTANSIGPSGTSVNAGTAVSNSSLILAKANTKIILTMVIAGAIGVGVVVKPWEESDKPLEKTSLKSPKATLQKLEQPQKEQVKEQFEEVSDREDRQPQVVNILPHERRKKSARRSIDKKAVQKKSIQLPVNSLRSELVLLRSAQRAFRKGDLEQTLRTLEKHQAKFPSGVLREERQTLRALTLCSRGDITKGKQIVRQLLVESPHTPLTQRIRRSCQIE